MKKSKLTLKQLEDKERRIHKQLVKIQDEIGKLIDKEREQEFLILKENVEAWNNKYDGHFVTELQERWDKEPDEEEKNV